MDIQHRLQAVVEWVADVEHRVSPLHSELVMLQRTEGGGHRRRRPARSRPGQNENLRHACMRPLFAPPLFWSALRCPRTVLYRMRPRFPGYHPAATALGSRFRGCDPTAAVLLCGTRVSHIFLSSGRAQSARPPGRPSRIIPLGGLAQPAHPGRPSRIPLAAGCWLLVEEL
jgi:hypothetical protein